MKRLVHQNLAVVGSAMFTGVMLTIGLALGRYWLDLEPQEFAVSFEANFILLLPCVAITLTPAFVGVGWLLKQDWNVPRVLSGLVGAVAALWTSLESARVVPALKTTVATTAAQA
jgi:hypothetical protein